ncbi:histone H2A deubiquitinase MYSM1 isoform 2-T2 [Pholidichthys leucotaenia]
MEGGALVQEQFIQSILPWELDNSISPENREVIEKMLLEEQYYLTGTEIPDHIWHNHAPKKPKRKRSPSKNQGAAAGSSSSSRWSKQEKDLFEEGLGKSEPKTATSSAVPVLHPQPPQLPSSHVSTLSNTIRIEKLSDNEDEDVDITDDLSDDGGADDNSQAILKTELSASEEQTGSPTDEQKEGSLSRSEMIHDTKGLLSCSSLGPQSPQSSPSLVGSDETGVASFDEKVRTVSVCPKSPQTDSKQVADAVNGGLEAQCEMSAQTGQLEEETPRHGMDSFDKTEKLLNDKPEKAQEEEEELKAPEEEMELNKEAVTEDEKQAIPEFFEGRPSKTPERYLKIRNYILDQWQKSKPKYLNKTSVRPGLKNCGDVNCIGRIHTYLELIGAINFNCEQAVYNRPRVVDRSKQKEGKDVMEAYELAQRLQSMRTRKRRVRDMWGNWCDAKDLEGQTYEHLSAEELALRREEMKNQPKPSKISRYRGSSDPFQLISCRSFEEDVKEPFQVIVCAETLLIMDMHAHVSRVEVIGLLGGTFDEKAKILKICAAEPCNSMSTGVQCEMDPVSQTEACDVLSSLGLSVVGWYHSHPSFHPNPSVRDIDTQDQFQNYFSRGGAPFIGMIVSPYDPANPSPHSQTTCLLVKETFEDSGPQKLPYKFDFLSSQDIPDWEQMTRRAQWIINKYSQAPGSVRMNRSFRRDSHLTFFEKMLASLARYLEPLPDEEGEPFLTQIQDLFLSDFISKQQSTKQEEEEECFNIPFKSTGSDDLVLTQLINEENSQEEAGSSETKGSPVLHLGSVLTSEHDYLL